MSVFVACYLDKRRRPHLEGRVGWHSFQHTYSSMLRQLDVDMKVQQELLRHADARITMNVYTQAVSEQKRAAHSSDVRMVISVERNEQRRANWTFVDIDDTVTSAKSVGEWWAL